MEELLRYGTRQYQEQIIPRLRGTSHADLCDAHHSAFPGLFPQGGGGLADISWVGLVKRACRFSRGQCILILPHPLQLKCAFKLT